MFRIPPGNVWGPDTRDRVRGVVEARSSVRSAVLPVPLRLWLQGAAGPAGEPSAAERLEVRAALTALKDIVRLRADHEHPGALDIALSVRDEAVKLRFR